MNLDFKDYSRKEELILTCQAHCMVSAFLYLMTSHSDDVRIVVYAIYLFQGSWLYANTEHDGKTHEERQELRLPERRHLPLVSC